MAISFNTGTTATTTAGTATGHTFTIPAGVLSGDWILVAVQAFSTATGTLTNTLTSSATTPVLVGSQVSTGINAGIQVQTAIWKIQATGSDAGATLTYGATGGSGGSYWFNVGLVAYTGAGGVDVSNGTAAYNASYNGSGGTVTTPSATTGVSGDWHISFCLIAPPGNCTLTTPTGLTLRESLAFAANAGILLGIADSNASVGSSGTVIGSSVWTTNGGTTSNMWNGLFTVGLQPAGGAGVAAPPPAWKPQPRRPGPVRARLGATVVAAGLVGTVGVVPAHPPAARPYIPHPQAQRARTGPAARNAAGLKGPGNHAASLPPPLWRPQPRRPGPARVLWHGAAGPANASFAVPATPPPAWRPQPRRPGPLRAIAKGFQGPGNHAAAQPPGVQPVIRHPRPQRALWRGLTGPLPRPTALPQPFLPPRIVRPHRAIWRAVTGTIAAPPAAASPPQLLRQPPRRRPYLRAIWRAVAGPGNAPGGAPLSDELLGGFITFQPYSGTITFQPYGGTITGGNMATQQDISGPNAQIVGNDCYFFVTILYGNPPVPLNLTGYTLKAVLKATRLTPDSEGLSFAIGSGLTVTNITGGQVTWVVPHADVTTALGQWYRIDVIDASNEVFTSLYGNFTVLPA